MTILGILLTVAGVISALYGNSMNNDLEAQLESFFSSGSTNPGNTFLYIGIAAAVVGVILLIVGLNKRKKST